MSTITVTFGPYESLTREQRDAWWLALIHEAEKVESTWSGEDPPDPEAVAQRVTDRLEDEYVPAEPADPFPELS